MLLMDTSLIFHLVGSAALWLAPAVPLMQLRYRSQGVTQTLRLSLEDAVDGRLRGLEFHREPVLAPTCRLLNFPEKGRRVFVHTHSIYANE